MAKKKKPAVEVLGGIETVYLGKGLRTALYAKVDETGMVRNAIIRTALEKYLRPRRKK